MIARITICLVASYVSWLLWGVYTAAHATDDVTVPYGIATVVTILGPLALALYWIGKEPSA